MISLTALIRSVYAILLLNSLQGTTGNAHYSESTRTEYEVTSNVLSPSLTTAKSV